MVINGQALLMANPIKDMIKSKESAHGTSYGLGEAGYDIRIKQDIRFNERNETRWIAFDTHDEMGNLTGIESMKGRFCLASAIEEFHMPNWLTGIVHDKSTWARRGLSVFNTVIEPGWKGFLTLELVYQGEGELIIPAGSGIAQVMFHEVKEQRAYAGKYQFQEDKPVPAIKSE